MESLAGDRRLSNSEVEIPRPDNLDEMLRVAAALSKGIRFCRVDLYSLPRVVFGEITFYHGSGWNRFDPESYDKTFGDFMELR